MHRSSNGLVSNGVHGLHGPNDLSSAAASRRLDVRCKEMFGVKDCHIAYTLVTGTRENVFRTRKDFRQYDAQISVATNILMKPPFLASSDFAAS